MKSLVFGGHSGLIGASVVAGLAISAEQNVSIAKVDWGTRSTAMQGIAHAVRFFFTSDISSPWNIYWAAGAARPGSCVAVHQSDDLLFSHLLERIACESRTHSSRRGAVVLVSSAGVMRQAVPGAPAKELNVVGQYSKLKRRQEEALHAFCQSTGHLSVSARLTNVYGRLRDHGRPIGLVQTLVQSAITGDWVEIFVNPSAIRNYIWCDDAGVAVSNLNVGTFPDETQFVNCIVASHENISIAGVVDIINSVSSSEVNVAFKKRYQDDPDFLGSTTLPDWVDASPHAVTSLREGFEAMFASFANKTI